MNIFTDQEMLIIAAIAFFIIFSFLISKFAFNKKSKEHLIRKANVYTKKDIPRPKKETKYSGKIINPNPKVSLKKD